VGVSWYAGWDLAFHYIPVALVDAEFAKHQLTLLTRAGLVAKLLQPRTTPAKKTTTPRQAKAVAKPRSDEPALVAV